MNDQWSNYTKISEGPGQNAEGVRVEAPKGVGCGKFFKNVDTK